MSQPASWLAAAAHRSPAARALLTPRRTWTYGELVAMAAGHGESLRAAQHATGCVLFCAAGATDLAMAALACAAAGMALLPLDPAAADSLLPQLQVVAGGRLRALPALSSMADAGAAQATISVCGRPDDLALVIATSGSEGEAKGVMLTNANLDAAAAAANQRLPLRAGDCWLGCLPLHHIGGVSIWYRCLRAGATMVLHEGFSASAVWRDLQIHQVSHLSLVPAMLARLLDVAAGAKPPASLRYLLIGGAALPRPLCERALAAGWPICPSWGMSESAAQAATLVCAGSDWQPGQVGPLLAGLEGRVAPDGRILLRGPQIMAGYLNGELRPGLGLVDGWLLTADLGSLSADGQVTIQGRADDMFNVGGVNVHPATIESCLAGCPGVSDVAVGALPDPDWGDTLVALIVGEVQAVTVAAWIAGRLPPAQRPRRVLKVAALPRNALGKLERRRLSELLRQIAGRAT